MLIISTFHRADRLPARSIYFLGPTPVASHVSYFLEVLDMVSWRLASAMTALLLCGCSIYPLPEDVTGYRSEDIARITRCYARDGIRNEITRVLDIWKDVVVYEHLTGGELKHMLVENPDLFKSLNMSRFTPAALALYRFYADMQISYDFTIDSIEMNSTGFDLAILKKFTSPSSNLLDFKSQNDRTREVKRQFRIYDSFDNLARHLENGYCDGVPSAENPIYPSTGLTRIDALVRDFVDQNQHNNLGSKDNPLDASMNDTITFTTKTSVNVDPSLNRATTPGSYLPSSLKLNADSYRQDIHTIIVLLTLPEKRTKLVLFDGNGNISSVGTSLRASKFEQIRANNFQDSVNNISTNINVTLPRLGSQ